MYFLLRDIEEVSQVLKADLLHGQLLAQVSQPTLALLQLRGVFGAVDLLATRLEQPQLRLLGPRKGSKWGRELDILSFLG